MTRLRALLSADHIDVVHAHSPVPAIGARLVRRTLPRRSRPAMVTTEHNVWPSHHPATRLVDRLTFRLDDAHLAVSEAVRQSVPPAMVDQVEVVVHGVDIDAVTGLADRDGARREMGVEDDEVLVGTVANLRPQKGYADLLKAAAEVGRSGRRVRFVSIGKGPLETELVMLRDELGLAASFEFLGYRPDAVRLMSGFDVFCLASHHEGLPVALMEALVLGLPVVATRAGGIGELVTERGEGLLVPIGQPDVLARGLLEVIDDPALRKELAAASATRGAGLSVGHSVRRSEAIYRSLARGRR